tara:strand:- start:439 stop:1062 length:624 start_codon:yes stop_codon:yes gene_type:complete
VLIDIFKTSIYKTEIESKDYIKWFKKALTYEKKINKKGTTISNVGGYQSTNYQGITNQDINREVFLKPAHSFCELLSPKKIFKLALHSWWMNENSFGHYNSLHNHHNVNDPILLSGIYYIEVPEKSGRLYLQTPNFAGNFPASTKDHFSDPITWGSYFIIPKKYDLILFPPGVYHMVEPNMSKQKRFSVAFNVQALPIEDNKSKKKK